MKLIYIGDLHAKANKFHKKGLDDFFNSELYPLITELRKKDEVAIIQCGDEFDNSSPDWNTWVWFTEHLSRWPQTYIVGGNHPVSVKKGNATLSLNSLPNVKVFSEIEMLTIDNLNLIFCPYPANSDIKESYHIWVDKNCDVTKQYCVVTHFASKENQFHDGEGINLQLPKGSIVIEGHTHTSAKYVDELGITHYTVGVPIPTRKGEETNKFQILIQDTRTGQMEHVSIDATRYFTYETLNYPELPKYNNSLLTIENIPVADKHLWRQNYKDQAFRIIGFKIQKDETETINSMDDLQHKDLDLRSSVVEYGKRENADQKVVDNIIEKMNMCEVD